MADSEKNKLIGGQEIDLKQEETKEVESPTTWSSYYFEQKKSVKIAKTAATVLCLMSLGLFLEMAGPTMTDLMARVGANYEEFATALVARSVGFCISAGLSGILAQKYPLHNELFLAFACLLGAIGSVTIPWCTNMWSISLMLHIQGHGQAFINTMTDVMVLALWGEKAAPALQTLHLAFGLGAILAPLIARPFLSDTAEIHDVYFEDTRNGSKTDAFSGSVTNIFKYNESSQLLTGQIQKDQSHVEVPYYICAGVGLAVGLVLLVFYINGTSSRKEVVASLNKKEKLETTEKEMPLMAQIMKFFSPGSCTGGKVAYGGMFFTLAYFYSIHAIGIERSYGRYIFSYAVLSKSFSSSSAALLNSVFWIGFSTGRALTSVLSAYLPELLMVLVQLFGNIVCAVVLTFWAENNITVLWIFCAVYGAFQAPLFPSMISWSNLYVEINGLAIAVLYAGVGTGSISYQWLTGYLFQYSTPQSLMYIVLGNSICITLTFALMLLVVRPHGKRFSYQQFN